MPEKQSVKLAAGSDREALQPLPDLGGRGDVMAWIPQATSMAPTAVACTPMAGAASLSMW